MKFSATLLAAGLALHSTSKRAACPFEKPHHGALNADEVRAFEAVKNGPSAAESLLNGTLQPLTGVLCKLDIPTPQQQGLKAIPGNDPGHQYQAPGPTDRRGMCTTLNTLANHGYISRDGITSFTEAANAVQTGYGSDNRVPNTLGPALGRDKHGVFEIDSSIIRQDTHFGNNANFLEDRWVVWVNQSKEVGGRNFGRDTMSANKGWAYDLSHATNPEFFTGAKWLVVSHAARAFVYRGLPNGTNQDVAAYQNIALFWLNETFRENLYRRAEPYNLVNMATDILDLFLGNPRALGSNKGLYNFRASEPECDFGESDDVACFLFENLLDAGAGQISPEIIEAADVVNGLIKGVAGPFFVDFNCSQTLSNYGAPSSS